MTVSEAFPFALNKEVVVDAKSDQVINVRAGIRDKDGLLAELSHKLSFPIRSTNFDSVSDWLGDLSWLAEGRVVLLHDAAPHLPRKELAQYLQCLLDAVVEQAEQGRTLLVAFPEQTRALTDALDRVKR